MMKPNNPQMNLTFTTLLVFCILIGKATSLVAQPAPAEKNMDASNVQTISVKTVGPVTQTTDLQIICILKHDPSGDKYIEALDDFNKKLHHLISGLRDRGEFAGELGETLIFTPPANTIAPKQVLLIGIGDEPGITPDRLQLAGEIAARESVCLGVAHVSFAPTLRDQGSTRMDVGESDAAFTTGWILAYDTEKKLAAQGLSSPANVSTLTIEAGPKFFDEAAGKIAGAVRKAAAAIQNRSTAAYTNN
jgi:hypothetical protein